jgi:hypothetical protein
MDGHQRRSAPKKAKREDLQGAPAESETNAGTRKRMKFSGDHDATCLKLVDTLRRRGSRIADDQISLTLVISITLAVRSLLHSSI